MPTNQKDRDALIRVLSLLRPLWRGTAAALVLGVTVILLTNALPLVILSVIDNGLVPQQPTVAMSGLGLLAGLGCLRWVCDVARRNLSGSVGLRLETELRGRLFAHLLALDVGWHNKTANGQVLSRVGSDIRTIRYFISFGALFMVFNALSALAAYAQIWSLSPQFALYATLVMPLFIFATASYGRRVYAVSGTLQQQIGLLTTHVEENASGIRVIKGLGREETEVDRFAEQAGRVRSENLAISRLQARYIPLTIGLPQLGLIAILWYGGYLTINGSLTIGTLIALSTYTAMLVWPISSMVGLFGTAKRAAASADRVFEILDCQPAVADKPAARRLPTLSILNAGARVTLENVSFRYPGGNWSGLTNVNIEVAAGEHVTVFGASGAGKSTLAALIPRLHLPMAGRLLIDGHDIAEVTLDSLREIVGFVPQDTTLLHGSIRDNLLIGRPDATDSELDRALGAAAAAELVQTLPQGLDTLVGEHGYMLSGGQRQRIALARALLMNPRVVVLDDALTQVDTDTDHRISSGLDSLLGDVTIICLSRPRRDPGPKWRVVVLDAGTLIDTDCLGTEHNSTVTVPAPAMRTTR